MQLTANDENSEKHDNPEFGAGPDLIKIGAFNSQGDYREPKRETKSITTGSSVSARQKQKFVRLWCSI